MLEGTPPDSRTGSTLPTMETADGRQQPYRYDPADEVGHRLQAESDTVPPSPYGPQYLPPAAPAPVIAGSDLQTSLGTDRYFEWASFATTQSYNGIPFDQMDRMDLMAAVGAVMGDLYQLQAKEAARQKYMASNMQQPGAAPPPGPNARSGTAPGAGAPIRHGIGAR